jgi:hypothetical protein
VKIILCSVITIGYEEKWWFGSHENKANFIRSAFYFLRSEDSVKTGKWNLKKQSQFAPGRIVVKSLFERRL